jgi:2-polyprenyl-6-methoxyphenol hydroxylase-like FAD-dependent oxidoreductase
MRIVCVGGGPAGLYFAIAAKLREPRHDVTVIERNPAGLTYGWGVVYWDNLLHELYRVDPVTARQIHDSSVLWYDQEVRVVAEPPVYLGGSGFSVSRERLIGILSRRAQELGVKVQFRREVRGRGDLPDADLIIAADGVSSRLRQSRADEFHTAVELGRNKYVWLGTDKVFDSFTFAFERTAAGWIWFHAYRFDSETSTCIIECSQQTWSGLGLDRLAQEPSLALLEDIFRRHLDGHALIDHARGVAGLPWLNFKRIGNEHWYHDNVVLVGDTAHTTHFAIGSGTTLAIEDAIALAEKLHDHDDFDVALKSYQEERRAAVRSLLDDERNSARWFEDVARNIERGTIEFAYGLENRRGAPRRARYRYLVHLATQQTTLRAVRRWRGSRRRRRAQRRWRLAGAQPVAAG